jgi:hypothetical protein
MFVKFWTEVLSLFLSITNVLFVKQNEVEKIKNKVIKPHGSKLFDP